MPVQADVDVFEGAVQQQIDLADRGFLGRRAVELDRSFQLMFFHRGFDGESRAERTGAQAAVSAAVPRLAGFDRILFGRNLLRQRRQRVVLGEQRDHRLAGTIGRRKRRRHAGEPGFDFKAFFPKNVDQQGRRFPFFQAQLGEFPDLPIDLFEQFGVVVDGFQRRFLRRVEFGFRAERGSEGDDEHEHHLRANQTPLHSLSSKDVRTTTFSYSSNPGTAPQVAQ